MIVALVTIGHSARALDPDEGCPCFSAAMIDALLQSIDSNIGQPAAAACMDADDKLDTRLLMSSRTAAESALVSATVKDGTSGCRFISDRGRHSADFHIVREGISLPQAYSCRTALVNSGAWRVLRCPSIR
jgi:hypothetical protein